MRKQYENRQELLAAVQAKMGNDVTPDQFKDICDKLWPGEANIGEGPYGDAELREVLQAPEKKEPPFRSGRVSSRR